MQGKRDGRRGIRFFRGIGYGSLACLPVIVSLSLYAVLRRVSDLDRELNSPIPIPAFGRHGETALSRLRVGRVAPDFRLQDPAGKQWVHLRDLRGKPVVLLFGSYT